ncbi:Ty transcription activator TEC1 [Pseudozyma hubeiensis]|nr:Ty transcription activator TEC1 [Pseudozyma hubeiensis]
MSTAQSSTPTGGLHHLFPSPTYSDSTLSSSSLLYTPDNDMSNLKQDEADRLHHDSTSINAANAAFASATKRNEYSMGVDTSDSSLLFAHNAPGIMDADMSGDAQSLAAALDFEGMNADMHFAFGGGDASSFLGGKRPTTSQPSGAFASMLHVRADSNSGRRHSIQPLMPSSDSSSSFAEYGNITGLNAGPRSMSISVDAFGSFAYAPNMAADTSANMQDTSGSGFLMSPPKLTVSMSSSNSPTPTPLAGFAEDAKRRRTSQVDATPERTVEHMTQHQRFLPQQTPPNMYAYQQQPQFSVGSSVGGGLETPASVQSSASPSRVRRLSLTAMDRADHISNLTASLALPGFNGEQAPKSAPPRAPADAMQRAQSQSSLARRASNDKSTPAKASASASNDSANANGKNQDVWPDDVEVAFWEALRLIPKLGRRKVLVHGKPCGRNELIADYIERKTNKVRTRKQVSSHIQVLKNIRKGDPEFQQLIAEPTTEEDFYIPAGGMMYAQTLAGYGYGGLGGGYPMLSMDSASGGLLSPYTPGLTGGQGLASPLSPCAPPLSATHAITSGLNDLHLPQHTGAKDTSGKTPCPILPASFSMWVHCSSGDEKHVYTKLDRNSMSTYANNQSCLPQMTLDSVRVGHFRFPRLAEMYHHMPCQFLHVHVPLSVPRHDVMMPRYDHFSTQLSLTSAQDLRLTSVTTVYSHGKRVLSLVEPLEAPRKISGRNGAEANSTSTVAGTVVVADENVKSASEADSSAPSQEDATSSTPVKSKNIQRRESDGSVTSLSPVSGTSSGPVSPRTPLDANNQSNGSLRHRWCHQAPFATDFWADFLSRNHPVNAYGGRDGLQSFGKEPSERAALGMAVSGVTIIQELVVAGEGAAGASAATAAREGAPALLNDAGSGLSPGSKVGDVVLVIAWDLECVESLGTSPGVPTVSLLTAGPGISPLGRAAPLASPLLHAGAGLHMGGAPGLSPMTPGFPHAGAAQLHPAMAHQQQPQLNTLNGASPARGFGHAQPPPSVIHTQPSPQPGFGFKAPAPTDGSNAHAQAPTLLRKRGLSMTKPNLMLSIPPAQSYLNAQRTPNGAMLSPHPQVSPAVSPTPAAWGAIQQRAVHTPITPFPQMGVGLCEPPPLNTGDDARMQKERLERHWANQGNPLASALPSPLDMSFNQAHVNGASMSSAGMAAAVGGHSESALGLMVPGGNANHSLPLLSPAGFDMGGKTLESGNNSFEQMLNDSGDLSHDASAQDYLNGLLASIGVEGQTFSS